MRYAQVREDDEDYLSPLHLLFQELKEEVGDSHPAVAHFDYFRTAAGKTAKSILISAAVRLAAFSIPEYTRLTSRDDMDFGTLGIEKRAIFCVTPISDTSMNFLVSMLYDQCFQELYYVADRDHNGRLPIPVRVIQDEWANVQQPSNYPQVLATCRSYNIGLNIILQNIQNVKSRYEKEWESIVGNCDTLLFLGAGNEPGSLEFFSKLLGKETVDTRTRGQSRGHSGSSSVNYQQVSRDLMTPDELLRMKNENCVLFIRGEDPVMDRKYNVKRHPNYRYTANCGEKIYVHQPIADHALRDLPYTFESLDDFDFDMEESK